MEERPSIRRCGQVADPARPTGGGIGIARPYLVSLNPVEHFFQKKAVSGSPEGPAFGLLLRRISCHIHNMQNIFLFPRILARSFL
jgi:hypothetical protein